MSLDGIINVEVKEGSFNGRSFKAFIRDTLECMNDFPAKNSVLVMDNAKIHKHKSIRRMVERSYVIIL